MSRASTRPEAGASFAAPGPWALAPELRVAVDGVDAVVVAPADLGAGGHRHPIVTVANGSHARPTRYTGLREHLASWGHVVVASTCTATGTGREVLAAARHVVQEQSRPGSPFEGRLAVDRVAAVGHSQGAAGAVNAALAGGGLVGAVVACNLPRPLWVSRRDHFDLTRLAAPTLLLTGTADRAICSGAVVAAYHRQLAGPAACAARIGAGHNAVQGPAHGFLGVITAWLRLHLAGDPGARDVFAGPLPQLLDDPAWTAAAVRGSA